MSPPMGCNWSQRKGYDGSSDDSDGDRGKRGRRGKKRPPPPAQDHSNSQVGQQLSKVLLQPKKAASRPEAFPLQSTLHTGILNSRGRRGKKSFAFICTCELTKLCWASSGFCSVGKVAYGSEKEDIWLVNRGKQIILILSNSIAGCFGRN